VDSVQNCEDIQARKYLETTLILVCSTSQILTTKFCERSRSAEQTMRQGNILHRSIGQTKCKEATIIAYRRHSQYSYAKEPATVQPGQHSYIGSWAASKPARREHVLTVQFSDSILTSFVQHLEVPSSIPGAARFSE
jgi:hypothetical protein